jgi:hypothetical protein
MIDENFITGLIGKRVSIAIKNLTSLCCGVIVAVENGNVILNPQHKDASDRIYISIGDIANILVK